MNATYVRTCQNKRFKAWDRDDCEVEEDEPVSSAAEAPDESWFNQVIPLEDPNIQCELDRWRTNSLKRGKNSSFHNLNEF